MPEVDQALTTSRVQLPAPVRGDEAKLMVALYVPDAETFQPPGHVPAPVYPSDWSYPPISMHSPEGEQSPINMSPAHEPLLCALLKSRVMLRPRAVPEALNVAVSTPPPARAVVISGTVNPPINPPSVPHSEQSSGKMHPSLLVSPGV